MSDQYTAENKEIHERALEERLYADALKEIEQGVRRDGLWAKALAKSNGNEDAAKGAYIEYRVQSLKDEIILESQETELKQKQAKESSDKERRELIDKLILSGEATLNECATTLNKIGYKTKQHNNNWIVIEPMGAKVKLTNDEFLEYVKLKVSNK